MHCFLCKSNSKIVYYDNKDFKALVGKGPIIEGYSLLSTKSHIRSFLDLNETIFPKYIEFKKDLKKLLSNIYGPVILTEHGRLPLCNSKDFEENQSHCYHAHQLVFPLNLELEDDIALYYDNIETYGSFEEFYSKYRKSSQEYLLYENKNDEIFVVFNPKEYCSQFFRRLVAEKLNRPKYIDWSKFPRYYLMKKALNKIKDSYENH